MYDVQKKIYHPYDKVFDSIIILSVLLLTIIGCATVYESVTPLQFDKAEVGIKTLEMLEKTTNEPTVEGGNIIQSRVNPNTIPTDPENCPCQ